MKKGRYLAIDIGASGGRHILGHVEDEKLVLEEIYRFANGPRRRGNSMIWDTEGLFHEIRAGIKRCADLGKGPDYIAIDTWGVDYVLLDRRRRLIGPAYSYRDSRSAAYVDTPVSDEALYRITGTARQPYNTMYQLLADKAAGRLEDARALFFLPEYFSYRLAGELGGKRQSEYTLASTSGLVDAAGREWALPIIERLGLPAALFDPIREPPYPVGSPDKGLGTGCGAEILMVASHDTASAVSVTGAEELYISSGTWSLLGIQSSPILTEAARLAGYTNEGALEGRVRFLKSIMGLWILQGVRRELGEGCSFGDLERLAREAEGSNGGMPAIDVNLPCFLSPPSMIEAVREAYRELGWKPESGGELAYGVYRSLAEGYKRAVEDLEAITEKTYQGITIIGGGSRDGYLNELSGRYTGKEIKRGPAEATAAGNILLQMKYAGEEAPRCIVEDF
ncbi:MAG: hypothetical protein LBH51_01565 [Treponema sp.]|jgi:rhamnulokinase|nr:hypothetical protein [Treponema sp.]